MTYKKYIAILFLLYSQFCFTQNLVTNGSFEDSLGNPSFTGWYMNGYVDTTFFFSSSDVPIGGGVWSIRLATVMPHDSHLAWYVAGIQGTYIYKLSVWAKKTVPFYIQYPPVIIAMGVIDSTYYNNPSFYGSNPSLEGIIYDSIPFNWDNVILIDTLTTQFTDTIAVILMGGTTINGPNDYAYYDLVELTVTDTLTTIQNTIWLQDSDIEIFPNPFNDYTTIQFMNKKHDCIQLTLFKITGPVIKQIETNEDQISIEKGELSDGMYFYQLINQNNGEFLGQGKLILQ